MVTISIVSHGHGNMVEELINSLLQFPEISLVIVTLNIPENIIFSPSDKLKIIKNTIPLGFGSNHNNAFKFSKGKYFCILNPDILFDNNPFPKLLKVFLDNSIALVAPSICNSDGKIEDSARYFLTLSTLFKRIFLRIKDCYSYNRFSPLFYPEWVGGMFMIIKSSIFFEIKGFDEGYFLYVEDVDICTRIWINGYRIALDPSVAVIHNAQRESRKNFRFMCWHLNGLIRYFYKYIFRLPKIS